MISTDAAVAEWRGTTAIDSEGKKIGKVDQVYYADDDGTPEWLTVDTGMFGTKTSFVPIAGARLDREEVRLAYTKDVVKDASGITPTKSSPRPRSGSCGPTTASSTARPTPPARRPRATTRQVPRPRAR